MACPLEECGGGDVLQHLLLLFHLEGGPHQILRPGPCPQWAAQHPAAQEAALDHLLQLFLHQHLPLPNPESRV